MAILHIHRWLSHFDCKNLNLYLLGQIATCLITEGEPLQGEVWSSHHRDSPLTGYIEAYWGIDGHRPMIPDMLYIYIYMYIYICIYIEVYIYICICICMCICICICMCICICICICIWYATHKKKEHTNCWEVVEFIFS